MTKYIFLLIPILLVLRINSQTINYCDYFSLAVSKEEYNGKVVMSYSPDILYSKKDAFSKFLKIHENRFSYLMWNKVDSLSEIASIYPDTLGMRWKFCHSVFGKRELYEYFVDLSPRRLITWGHKHLTFSIEEMLKVASRYFYASKVNPVDTTIERSICVGKNGQAEILTTRDLTLLEAFTFEAIFYYLLKNTPPQFEVDFDDCIAQSLETNKKMFQSYEVLLMNIRNECYNNMSINEDLKHKLLKYYRKNKNNLNFEIVGTGI